MKSTFLMILIVSMVLIGLITSCSKDEPNSRYKNIQDLVTETVAGENIPGMIAAIVDSNGIVQIESAGVRKTGSLEQITNNDHFHLGSCTKAMTSALLATMVANNKIQWGTTLIEVFPELKDTIRQEYHNITLHQLVTHRAGITNNFFNFISYENLAIEERRYLNMKILLKEPGEFNSGEFHYSNIGYAMAGIMAERITGQSWETLMQSHLFEPLGMNSAGFGPPGTINQIEQPWGHNKSNGVWQPTQLDNPEEIGPAGTVHCSILDWAKFISLFVKKDNTIILERNQLDKLTDPVGDYACGWYILQRDWANGTAITHNGSNTMWHASVWIAPEINRAYIVATNSKDENTSEVSDKVMGWLIGIDQN